MKYQLKQIHCRPWTLSGLSLPLIESHYENNYGGARSVPAGAMAIMRARSPGGGPRGR